METFIHEYKGFGGCESRCKVYMVSDSPLTHFCFEELDDNYGTSVTNMSEYLATQMIQIFNLKPYECFFYETYPHSGKDRSFDEIKYIWIIDESPKSTILKATKPHWKPSDKREIFELTI